MAEAFRHHQFALQGGGLYPAEPSSDLVVVPAVATGVRDYANVSPSLRMGHDG